MKSFTKYVLFALFAVVLLAGCSKQPAQEINDAKAAIDAVTAEGAEKYAREDVKMLNDSLTAALDEVKLQDGKFLKNYDAAKDMLVKVKSDAETLKVELPARKEKAMNDALAAQQEAKTAVDDAKALLQKAPKGKGSRADIEALKADVTGLEGSLSEVQTLVETEEYFDAMEKAASVKAKAQEVSVQITQAMEKAKK